MSTEHIPATSKFNVWLPLAFSLILAGGMWIGAGMQSNPPNISAIRQQEEALSPSALGQGKLEELIRYIESRYVETVNNEELVKEAINHILLQLDPHSSYISAAQLEEVNEQLDGSFDGIGIEFIVVDDTVVVLSAIAGGPAANAGILPGDKIVSVEDSLTLGKNIDYAGILKKLRGDRGSRVAIGIQRAPEKELRSFTLTRERIPVNSVEVAYMLDEQTGFIKINRFSSNTYEEFMNALEELVERQQMKHLVLDLRQNGGGYLQEATNILSQFFKEKDKLLVFTEGSHVPRTEYKSTGRSFYDIDRIAVLTDEGSASASEIIAGAVQDWDRGLIIGRRTYGKGLVQEQYNLRDGSALRLTVAKYYTPSGRCIQKPYEDHESYEMDVARRMENGELYDGRKADLADTTRFFTQRGRVVYGGGGIQPDIFVPMDSSLLSPYFLSLQEHVSAFAFRYLESQKQELGKMPLEQFVSSFKLEEDLLSSFHRFAIGRGVHRSERQWRAVKGKVAIAIKAGIARHIWSEKGYFQVMNQRDPAVIKALSSLQTPM